VPIAMADPLAFQDYYPDHFAHCYGCGRLNAHGLRIRSYWTDDGSGETVARLAPRREHVSIPGYVYGGWIASLIDCHCVGSAAAAAHRAQGRPMEVEPRLRFLTGTLQVQFVAPTPLGSELECRGRIEEVKARKVTVSARVLAGDMECARGQVIAIQVPDELLNECARAAQQRVQRGGDHPPRSRDVRSCYGAL
jgi:acyl-coenzyme A thioesterase PaaI-like protein